MSKKRADMSNPITGRANELASLFAKDKQVKTKFVFDARTLEIHVASAAKALALAKILKKRIKLGNLWLDVNVYLPNGSAIVEAGKVTMTPADFKVLWRTAFKGNKNFSRILQAKDRTDTIWTFALFGRQACSWQNDDTQNPELASSALPEEIIKYFAARHPGVQISTDVARIWEGVDRGLVEIVDNADHRKQRGRTAPNGKKN